MAKRKRVRENRKITSLEKLLIGEEKTFFIENIEMLLSAGVTILSALESIKKDSRSRIMRRLIENIIIDIDNGSTISESFKKTHLFSPQTISLIRIGEETGSLPNNLKVIVRQLQKEKEFRSKIHSAMIYPIFIFFITIVVGASITWFVLPRLATVFSQMRIELPTVTKAIIYFGEFLSKNGSVAVPGFLLTLSLLIYLIFFFKPLKFVGQAILFKIPGIKKLLHEAELASFGYSLGNMLKAGLTIDYALNSLAKTTVFSSYKNLYSSLTNNVRDGTSLRKSLSSYPNSRKKIPSPVQQMLGAAEQSGRLPDVLIQIGEIYEERIETTTKNLSVILEPALLVVVWFCVLIVAISIISPIYSLVGNINKEQIKKSDQSANQISAKPASLSGKGEKEKKAIGKVTIIESAKQVNIYEKPSIKAKVIKKASGNEAYQYSARNNSWHEIILSNQKTGWVSNKYLKEIN